MSDALIREESPLALRCSAALSIMHACYLLWALPCRTGMFHLLCGAKTKPWTRCAKYSTAMELYATTSKDASYPATLSALAPPLEAGKKASSGKIDAALMCGQASCVDNGYRFEFRPVFKEERVASYTISARPLEFEETGNRSLLLTADGKIYETRENRNALLTDRQR